MKKLFKLFQNNSDEFDLYNDVKKMVEAEVFCARGEENRKAYMVLVDLVNSINNAGCEDRRSSQIDTLRKAMAEICDKYESFLP